MTLWVTVTLACFALFFACGWFDRAYATEATGELPTFVRIGTFTFWLAGLGSTIAMAYYALGAAGL